MAYTPTTNNHAVWQFTDKYQQFQSRDLEGDAVFLYELKFKINLYVNVYNLQYPNNTSAASGVQTGNNSNVKLNPAKSATVKTGEQ